MDFNTNDQKILDRAKGFAEEVANAKLKIESLKEHISEIRKVAKEEIGISSKDLNFLAEAFNSIKVSNNELNRLEDDEIGDIQTKFLVAKKVLGVVGE